MSSLFAPGPGVFSASQLTFYAARHGPDHEPIAGLQFLDVRDLWNDAPVLELSSPANIGIVENSEQHNRK